jgi:hypothetical protein
MPSGNGKSFGNKPALPPARAECNPPFSLFAAPGADTGTVRQSDIGGERNQVRIGDASPMSVRLHRGGASFKSFRTLSVVAVSPTWENPSPRCDGAFLRSDRPSRPRQGPRCSLDRTRYASLRPRRYCRDARNEDLGCATLTQVHIQVCSDECTWSLLAN